MKTKILFFCLLVLSTITSFGQTITLTTTGYDPVVISKSEVVNIRSNTQLTIVASGLGETYWTVDKDLITIGTPLNPVFPNTNNTVIITIPSIYDDFVLTVYFASPLVSIPITFVRNDKVSPGLLTKQDVEDCSGVNSSFLATNPFQTGFEYQWEEELSGSWINLTANSYYSATGYVLNIQANSSIVGKKFRAIVKNPNCLGAIDETGYVEVKEVYQLPIATFSPTTNICAGEEVELVVTPKNGSTPYSVTMNNGTGDLIVPNNINPVTGIVGGGTAKFNVQPSVTTTYHFMIVDANGCSVIY